ncbi:hypothetical protein BDV96DRAFT_663270 [Lophiotrema nucula]|uniref:Uncharacterized protein n=1 Tax=Lophiotrema nucula TaxID=690887 RepID=A0A6A5ZV87_9PLEO|nr:hypothetical protein BDV96DRAFT_663270 [Lophiotrema nucula]
MATRHRPPLKHFRFLDLPRELRLMVYERLPRTIGHKHVVIHHHSHVDDRSAPPTDTITLVTRATPTSILATSKQIYYEAFDAVNHAITNWVLEGGVKIIMNTGRAAFSGLEIIALSALEKTDGIIGNTRPDSHLLIFRDSGLPPGCSDGVFLPSPLSDEEISTALLARASRETQCSDAPQYDASIHSRPPVYDLTEAFKTDQPEILQFIDKSARSIVYHMAKQQLLPSHHNNPTIEIVLRPPGNPKDPNAAPFQSTPNDSGISNYRELMDQLGLIMSIINLEYTQALSQARGVEVKITGWLSTMTGLTQNDVPFNPEQSPSHPWSYGAGTQVKLAMSLNKGTWKDQWLV